MNGHFPRTENGGAINKGISDILNKILAVNERDLDCVVQPGVSRKQLNDYLRDNNEYRAITRNLLHLGGHITYTPTAITVILDTPAPPRLARAVAMLLDEINTAPPRIPGDTRPITYQLATA